MKRIMLLITGALLIISTLSANAQELSTGVDIYSSYIWRGAKFGTGPAFQPSVEFTQGGLAVGAWGSVCTSDNEALEMDLYASYGFDFGLTATVTDYYFGSGFLTSESHFIEPMLNFTTGNLSLTGAYMVGHEINDAYAEIGYTLGSANLFMGAGNGQYTKDGNFNICNIGIGTSKEIKLTDSFSLPVSGSVVLNPSTEGFFITVGFSL